MITQNVYIGDMLEFDYKGKHRNGIWIDRRGRCIVLRMTEDATRNKYRSFHPEQMTNLNVKWFVSY